MEYKTLFFSVEKYRHHHFQRPKALNAMNAETPQNFWMQHCL